MTARPRERSRSTCPGRGHCANRRFGKRFGTTRALELGAVGIKCRVRLWLDLGSGRRPAEQEFAVDSGASYTLMSLKYAQSRGLPTPPPDAETSLFLLTAHGDTPMRVRPGRMRCWLGKDRQGYPFDWPVLFRVNAPRLMPPILGLGGVIHTCRWTFDGTYSLDAPHGALTLEDIR